MDAGIITAIVGGSCGCLSIILQKLLDVKCVKCENFDGSIKNFHCIPKLNNCVYPIPDNDVKDVLTLYREPPGNWNFSKDSIYTKKTPENYYLIIVPEGLKNDINDNMWQGNVIWYREYSIRSYTNKWFLETELDYIKNSKYTKIFIKRFCNNTNYNWKYLENNSEYFSANNGRNSFETESKIGHILEEEEIEHDEHKNAIKIKKTYECTHEQIGIIVYSRRINDLILPNLNCFNNNIDINKIISTSKLSDFNDDLINKIEYNNTGTCLIRYIYIGEETLYIY